MIDRSGSRFDVKDRLDRSTLRDCSMLRQIIKVPPGHGLPMLNAFIGSMLWSHIDGQHFNFNFQHLQYLLWNKGRVEDVWYAIIK
jgi:hypothetical protein